MRLNLLPLALLFAFTTSAVHAEDWAPTGASVTWENDLFGGTDRHYTNGAELGLVGAIPEGVLPAYLGDYESQWRLTLGQSIYAPEQLRERDVILDDRPYAGWLRLGVSLERRSKRLPYTDRVGLEIGLLGPASGAGATQKLFHAFIGSPSPKGWRNQLQNELGVRVTYEFGVRAWRSKVVGLDYELEPRVGFSLGNVRTHASLGATVRVGRVPDVYSGAPHEGPYVFLSLGGEVRFVAHDVFLDGSLLRSGGHRVRKRRVVADLSLGLTVQITDGFSLSYTHTYRTPEFLKQGQADQFGSINLTFSW
ncbi:MAG: lipid A deacylase LpxR family protein [Planctomycetes bacterium]|nr:lipid A deacylase LpxR family protein [Planctomycetota bacterium]